MAPRDHFEFIILRLTFVPYIDPQYPRFSWARKKNSPNGSSTLVRDWFDRAITREKAKLPPNSNIRYAEWRVNSGSASLFTVNGHRFDKVIIFIGEETSHWIFYQSLPLHRRIEGCGLLPLKYCGCCIHKHYLNVVDTIKKCLLKPK